MAHTNQTPNYELSQFLGTDKPAWLVDYNGDMEKIDLGLKAAKDVADAAKEEADQGALDISALELTVTSTSAKATGAISDISDAYDATSTYDLNDLVIYNNLLYKCTTAITVPEAFDGTHWTRTTIEELIDTINSNLSGLNQSLTILNGGVLTYRPVTLNLSKNEVYTTDSYGNFILPNSINDNLIISIRILGGNYMNKLGYNPSLGYYCHVEDVDGNPVTNTTVTVDVLYIPNAFH